MRKSKKKSGLKIDKSIPLSGGDSISKYKKIKSISYVPGRPGEDYYSVLDQDGKEHQLSHDQKRELDKHIKKK